MPQQFASVDYSPIMSAGRAFGRVAQVAGQGFDQFQQNSQVNKRNEDTYNQALKFIDYSGVQYDPERLKPRPGEENYDQRLKTEIAPILGKMEQNNIDVKKLVQMVNTPGVAWDQVASIMGKQKGIQQQQQIGEAVKTAARGIEPVAVSQEAGTAVGEPVAPKTQEEFYGAFSKQKLPEGVTYEQVKSSPEFVTAASSYPTMAEVDKKEKNNERLKMALQIWEKVKAGNKLYKSGVYVDKPNLQDIYVNMEEYSLEPGVAPRPSGSGSGGAGNPDEKKLQAMVIQRLAAENQSDFDINDPLTGLPFPVPKVKPNTRSAQILGNTQAYRDYVNKYYGPEWSRLLNWVPKQTAPQKGAGF